MPINPEEAQAFLNHPEFQAADPVTKLGAFKKYLQANDEEFASAPDHLQGPIARQTLDMLGAGQSQPQAAAPTGDHWWQKHPVLGTVASFVPGIGEYQRGVESAEAGQPVEGLFSTAVQNAFSSPEGMADPTTRGLVEGGIGLAKGAVSLVAAEALMARFLPALAAPAVEMAGKALGAAGESTAINLGVQAAKQAKFTGLIQRLGTDATMGEMYHLLNAADEMKSPIDSGLITEPAAMAAFGMVMMGAGKMLERFGPKGVEQGIKAINADPRIAGQARQAQDMVDAFAKFTKTKPDEAGQLLYKAASERLDPADHEGLVFRLFLQNHPQLLDSEFGRHMIRMQRAVFEHIGGTESEGPGRIVYEPMERDAVAKGELPRSTVTVSNPKPDQLDALVYAHNSGRIRVISVDGDKELRGKFPTGTVNFEMEPQAATPGTDPARDLIKQMRATMVAKAREETLALPDLRPDYADTAWAAEGRVSQVVGAHEPVGLNALPQPFEEAAPQRLAEPRALKYTTERSIGLPNSRNINITDESGADVGMVRGSIEGRTFNIDFMSMKPGVSGTRLMPLLRQFVKENDLDTIKGLRISGEHQGPKSISVGAKPGEAGYVGPVTPKVKKEILPYMKEPGVTYERIDSRTGQSLPITEQGKRIDLRPGPYEYFTKTGVSGKTELVTAGGRVPKEKLAAMRAESPTDLAKQAVDSYINALRTKSDEWAGRAELGQHNLVGKKSGRHDFISDYDPDGDITEFHVQGERPEKVLPPATHILQDLDGEKITAFFKERGQEQELGALRTKNLELKAWDTTAENAEPLLTSTKMSGEEFENRLNEDGVVLIRGRFRDGSSELALVRPGPDGNTAFITNAAMGGTTHTSMGVVSNLVDSFDNVSVVDLDSQNRLNLVTYMKALEERAVRQERLGKPDQLIDANNTRNALDALHEYTANQYGAPEVDTLPERAPDELAAAETLRSKKDCPP